MSKKLINGLKYEKQTEDQLHDLSQWELVDIILAYRKDLQAKEQECEELKKRISNYKCPMNNNADYCGHLEDYGELLGQLDQLKAENDEYSLFIEKLLDYAGLECDSEEQAMRTLSDLASQMNKVRWIIDRYKQTLTEIKEIAEVLITITDEYDNCYHKSECDKCLLGINGDCQYIKVEQILQKISEVIE